MPELNENSCEELFQNLIGVSLVQDQVSKQLENEKN